MMWQAWYLTSIANYEFMANPSHVGSFCSLSARLVDRDEGVTVKIDYIAILYI